MIHACAKISKRARLLIGATFLIASTIGNSAMGFAASATLIMPDICDNPVTAVNTEWAKLKYGSNAVFYMDTTGAVAEITSTSSTLDSFDTVYVVAHGNATHAGGVTHANFATYFKSAHASTPDEVFFVVCGAANASGGTSGSLMKQLNAKYSGNIKKLSGGASGCSLTPNGTPILAKAEFKDAVTRSQNTLFGDIKNNIMGLWDPASSGSSYNYKTMCKMVTGQSSSSTFNKTSVVSFIAKVNTDFASSASSGTILKSSTSYLDLIQLNDGSSNLTVCGKDTDGAGTTVTCP